MVSRFFGSFALLLMMSGSAHAQSVPTPPAPTVAPVVEGQHAVPSPEEPRPIRWYGAPILIGDVVAYASLGLAAANEGTASVAVPVGIGAFLLTGPITHGLHRQWGRMGLSIAARTVLPFAGLLVGAGSCNEDSDCSPTLVVGAVALGMLTASVVDTAALAYEPVPASASVQPLVAFGQDRFWLGAGGTF